jgi:hypothetical protein
MAQQPEKKHTNGPSPGDRKDIPQNKVMAELLKKPRVMNIGTFPDCRVDAAEWRSRLENYRIPGTDQIAAHEYGDLQVQTFELEDLLPEIGVIYRGESKAPFTDPETGEVTEVQAPLQTFVDMTKRWFSYGQSAFVETKPDGKTLLKDPTTGQARRLHLIAYRTNANLRVTSSEMVIADEIFRAINGEALDMECWCFRRLVRDVMSVASHGDGFFPRLTNDVDDLADTMAGETSDEGWIRLRVSPALPALTIQRICQGILSGTGNITTFVESILPLMYPVDEPPSSEVAEQVVATYESCQKGLDFGRLEDLTARQDCLSWAAIRFLMGKPWRLLEYYIRDQCPGGNNRLVAEVFTDPNVGEENRVATRHALDLHPAVRAANARLLLQARVEARDQPWRGPRQFRKDLTADVLGSGQSRILDLVMQFSGKPRVQLLKS